MEQHPWSSTHTKWPIYSTVEPTDSSSRKACVVLASLSQHTTYPQCLTTNIHSTNGHKTDYACTAMPTACLCEGVTSFISNTMITHEKIIKLATAPESRAIFSRGEGRAGWRDGEPRTNEPSNVDSMLCVFWSHTLKVKIAHGSEARTRRKSCAHSVISSWLGSALDSGADSGV